ncbi:MAG: hypothetical protein ACYC40_00045 [Patescibacteria group bacterium]
MSDEKKIKKILKVEKVASSGLSAFVERPLPSEKEVSNFEKIIEREARHQEIDSNLSEIYRSKDGSMIDVKKVKIKKRQLILIKFFRTLLLLGILGLAAYSAYVYLLGGNNDARALELNVVAPEKVSIGEEFSYKINYHNATAYNISNVHLEIQYPANFIFSKSSVPSQSGNYGWDLADLAPGGNGSIDISGIIINKSDSVNIISVRLSYTPSNISSQFVKEASASTLLNELDFQTDLNYANTAFLNQDNDLTLIFSNIKNNYLGDFNLSFTLPEETNVAIANNLATSTTDNILASSSNSIGPSTAFSVIKSGGTSWLISGLNANSGRQEVAIKYKIAKDILNKDITIRLEKRGPNNKLYVFWEKTISPELIKSDLNLSLFLNGSKNDQAVNFSQALNYTLNYSNKGKDTFKNVTILAAVNGDLVNWASLKDEKSGERSGATIIWTSKEIPELAEIKPGQEGKINFTLNLDSFKESDLGQNLSLSSYAQYSVGEKTIKKDENKSNIINSRINSDLNLTEKILYFDNDNNSVGSGPLPPKVGEKTGLHVFWTVKNNLHELSDTKVIFNLPSYISWDGKSTASIGKLYFDNASHKIIWEIGNLPVSTYQANADFGISLTPIEGQRDKILIISQGSTVSATDNETKDLINKKIDSKTTKLEDDEMVGLDHSGLVQ